MPTASYWCYRCTRVIRITDTHTAATCPRCSGGFIEAIDSHAPPDLTLRRRRRHRHHAADWTPFNPVIVLRAFDSTSGSDDRGFELFYDDGTTAGLQPLPEMMSEFLMESGFDRLLEQLSQIDLNGLNRSGYSPASKSAIDSLRKIELNSLHVSKECTEESVCAVCIEELNLVNDLSEMPCKHIYHSECIVKWLNMRNTCPVCRLELPKESLDLPESEAIELNELNNLNESNNVESPEERMAVGLTIWRLPGGGFAVGRFSGGRRAGGGERERELPVVFTEGEGVFSDRRVRYGESGIGRVFRNVVSVFGRLRGSGGGGFSSRSRLSLNGATMNRSRSLSSAIFGRMRSRRREDWNLEEQNGMARL